MVQDMIILFLPSLFLKVLHRSIDLEKSLLTVLHASAPASLAQDDSKVHIGTDTPPLGFGD